MNRDKPTAQAIADARLFLVDDYGTDRKARAAALSHGRKARTSRHQSFIIRMFDHGYCWTDDTSYARETVVHACRTNEDDAQRVIDHPMFDQWSRSRVIETESVAALETLLGEALMD